LRPEGLPPQMQVEDINRGAAVACLDSTKAMKMMSLNKVEKPSKIISLKNHQFSQLHIHVM